MSSDSRTIIHFTKSAEALKGILSIGFKLKYCRERIWFRDTEKRFRIPMVSFCDIPISQAQENMGKYGGYALGLTEEWANEQGLTPVVYLQRHSNLADSMLKNLDASIAAAPLIREDPPSTEDPLMSALDILRYTKNYVGELVRANGDRDPKYYFGDEREWRYSLKTRHFSKYIYMEEMASKPGIAEIMQALIADERLMFAAKDVRYIIIEREEERAGMESHIRSIKDRFSEEDINTLISRICTAAQLSNKS